MTHSRCGGAPPGPMEEKDAALEELRQVDKQLKHIEQQIESLYEEQSVLEARKTALDQVLKRPVQEQRDWTSSFPWDTEVKSLLEGTFRLESFRPNQLEAINAALSGRDVFVVMRTGGGKSIIYMLSALKQHGISIIVSPLLSLISDQVMQLDALAPGTVSQLVGSMPREEINAVLRSMKDPSSPLRLVYITPEKVAKSKMLMSTLEQLSASGRLCRFIIDEAHCSSQWGHDFRGDYSKLGVLRRLFPKVPIMALTATATPDVIRDVCEILEMHSPVHFKSSWDRPNLVYEVVEKPASLEDAAAHIHSFISSDYPRGAGIVYCFSQKQAEDVAQLLNRAGVRSGVYHAGVDAEVKDRVLRQWSNDQLQVVVATIAFGLGISKPNVRFVIHFSLSKSMESYYQESGRAGRDGQRSTCRLLYRAQDASKQAGLVMYERAGLRNLRKMVAYAQSGRECRRVGIARGLGESYAAEGCGNMCDVCRGLSSPTVVDMTAVCVSLLETLEGLGKKEKRATTKQLGDAWRKGNNRSSALNNEMFERFVQHLLILGVLQEDFHATAYTTNVYLLPGAKAGLVQKGQMRVNFEMPGDGKESGASGGIKRKKVMPPSSDEESEWEEDSKPPAVKKVPPQSAGASSGQTREVVEISDSETDDADPL